MEEISMLSNKGFKVTVTKVFTQLKKQQRKAQAMKRKCEAPSVKITDLKSKVEEIKIQWMS